MAGTKEQRVPPPPPLIRVSLDTGTGDRRDWEFQRSFRIGRVENCDLCIKNEFVSRSHAEVAFDRGQWWVRDLQSSNGVFVNGQKVDAAPVGKGTTIRLGIEGPVLHLSVEQPAPAPPPRPAPLAGASETVVARYVDHYFGKGGNQPVGEHTMMVRQAFSRVQQKQKRKYGNMIALLGVVAVAIGMYAFYLRRQAGKQTALAESIFYSMKSLDVEIGGVEKLVMDAGGQQGQAEILKLQSRRKEMEKNYDQFLTTLRVYDPNMSEQDRLILRVARIFGECELAMPPGFAAEVKNYIGKWKSSSRLANDIRLAKQKGYDTAIAKELLKADLPPQFFYLALQESNFDEYANGPPTRSGIAKGMWQFIPNTAVKYGLRIGPLVELPRTDIADDRHHFDRETVAAARYLKDLYTTDAQASGFLVMACYNWGEGYVLPLVQKMPPNPKERNFWRLLALYKEKIPPETYNYVFYIVSAAVIGENPRLFGFDFENPLAHVG